MDYMKSERNNQAKINLFLSLSNKPLIFGNEISIRGLTVPTMFLFTKLRASLKSISTKRSWEVQLDSESSPTPTDVLKSIKDMILQHLQVLHQKSEFILERMTQRYLIRQGQWIYKHRSPQPNALLSIKTH